MPAGKVAELMVRAALIAIWSEPVAVCPDASVTRTTKLELPGVVGVPEIIPFAPRVRPAGNEPVESAHVYGAVPPLAERLVE